MAALEAGKQAPDISAPLIRGGSFRLAEARKHGPVLAAFFKVNCPVCQSAFPYLQRIHSAYGNHKFAVVGVSQNDESETTAFMRQYGVTFPVALDELKKYPASNAYGLTNVPSLFLISPEGKVTMNSVGWSKADFERLNREAAKATGAAVKPLFNAGDDVPEFKPG